MSRDRTALLIALGVDNFGSGLFLPLTLVYVTEVVGLPLGVAGVAVAVGTMAGRVWRPGPVLADRRFLALIGMTALVALSLDFFLAGMPVYVLDQLQGEPWLPGVLLAWHTAITSVSGTLALHATRRLSRPAAMAAGAALIVAWCIGCVVAWVVRPAARPATLLAAGLLMAVGSVLFGARSNALAEGLAPDAARGRHLAAFQYACTVPGVLAPAVVALFAVSVWLPWAVVGGCAAVAAGLLRMAGRHGSKLRL